MGKDPINSNTRSQSDRIHERNQRNISENRVEASQTSASDLIKNMREVQVRQKQGDLRQGDKIQQQRQAHSQNIEHRVSTTRQGASIADARSTVQQRASVDVAANRFVEAKQSASELNKLAQRLPAAGTVGQTPKHAATQTAVNQKAPSVRPDLGNQSDGLNAARTKHAHASSKDIAAAKRATEALARAKVGDKAKDPNAQKELRDKFSFTDIKQESYGADESRYVGPQVAPAPASAPLTQVAERPAAKDKKSVEKSKDKKTGDKKDAKTSDAKGAALAKADRELDISSGGLMGGGFGDAELEGGKEAAALPEVMVFNEQVPAAIEVAEKARGFGKIVQDLREMNDVQKEMYIKILGLSDRIVGEDDKLKNELKEKLGHFLKGTVYGGILG